MKIKELRISRLLNPISKKSVIIPIDHGLIQGNIEGLQNPVEILNKLIKLGIDGTLMSPGVAKITTDFFLFKDAPGRILTADIPLLSTIPGETGGVVGHKLIANVEFALRYAFDIVKVLLPWGEEENVQMDSIEVVGKIINECDKWNIPVMVEPVLWGVHIPKERQNEIQLIEHASRMALEIGADILKIPYTGNIKEFKDLVSYLKVPIFVLGGPKMNNILEVLMVAKESVEAGAAGIVFGRNVWQNPRMDVLVKALKEIVHENNSIEEVTSKYNIN
jgi:class I fructose-bisphosphate aldolase